MQWTSFDNWPANKNTVQPYIDDPDSIPCMNIGDDMYMVNGCITPLMNAIEDAYEANKDSNDEWHVVCPVVAWEPPQNRGILKGYVHYMITGVKATGQDKGIKGYWANNGEIVAQGAGPGGSDYGVRAAPPFDRLDCLFSTFQPFAGTIWVRRIKVINLPPPASSKTGFVSHITVQSVFNPSQ